MAVTYDATTPFAVTADTSPYEFSHTVASGSNRLLIVATSITSSVDVTAVTYNGDALTFLDTAANSGRTVELWYLVAPDEGTFTVSITGNGTGNGYAAATSFQGVDQATPFGTQQKSSGVGTATATAAITVPTDGMGYDAGVHSGGAACPTGATATGDNTDRWSACDGGNTAGGYGGTIATAGSKTASWSFAAANFGHVAVPINPAATTVLPTTSDAVTVAEGTTMHMGINIPLMKLT